MTENSLSSQFPRKQIKPYDGMSITADVWAQAHDEHRQTLSAHTAFLHGVGIIAGLDVIANDPASQIVFISPGVAVDQTGRTIVVPEPVSYDFGNTTEGVLYLLLGYGERELGEENTEPRYLQSEFVIAARPVWPKRPVIELARITISREQKTIQNAVAPAHPAQNELDLRFRQYIQPKTQQTLRVAICHLGSKNKAVLQGWDQLINAYQHPSPFQFIVDDDVPFSESIVEYDLVYVGCSGTSKADTATLQILKHCISKKTPLILESLDDAADAACSAMLTALEQAPKSVGDSHSILSAPYLFTRLPAGARAATDVKASANLVYSTAAYSLAWNGQIAGAPGSRADIRDVHEFGINLINYLTHTKRKK